MGAELTAVVVGAGWAGEGHTIALRLAGVEVVAICARRKEVVQRVADRLDIPEASTDWRRTLEARKPDIVALTTPAALRSEVIEVAAELGCHLLCEKPLATTAQEAGRLYRLVRQAGVKHAYAATHRYDPSVAWLAELVRDGAIGTLWEMEMRIRTGFPRPMPWSWMRMLASGGGVLNNLLPHLLGIFERVTSGQVVRAMGAAKVYSTKAPVVPDIHDFREWIRTGAALTPEQLSALEWRPCDADDAFVAILGLAVGDRELPCALAHGPGQRLPGDRTGLWFYGEQGTLFAEGVVEYSVFRLARGGEVLEPLDVPQRLRDALPQVGDHVQNKWCALAREFVADIRGEPHDPYLTFRDGWRYQQVIEAIRSGQGWSEVIADLPQ
ncbi:MAG: hypothetical protein KatS3mg115_0263 [Candidatus Poribacteria bacterium]|nr:MAG: hypothetical protein KatS3mg115_0263 [Candidatus Poribacteria bacterium]